MIYYIVNVIEKQIEVVDMNFTTKALNKRWKNKLNSCEVRGIEMKLTQDQFFNLFLTSNGLCDYTSTKMSSDPSRHDYVSIERIDETKGYQLGNICLVRKDINTIKGRLLDHIDTVRQGSHIKADMRPLVTKMLTVVFDKEKMQELKDKYKHIGDTMTKPLPETNVEALSEDFKINEDVYMSKDYIVLGELVGSVTNFSMNFSEYKRKMSVKKCQLTKRKFEGSDCKVLYWVDKKKEFTYSNTLTTTKVIQEALDTFSAKTNLSLTGLRNVVSILSKESK